MQAAAGGAPTPMPMPSPTPLPVPSPALSQQDDAHGRILTTNRSSGERGNRAGSASSSGHSHASHPPSAGASPTASPAMTPHLPPPSHSHGHGGGGGGLHHEKVKRVGEWIFGETLGQGSFGKVKLAYHAKSREKVAIKIVEKSGIANVEDVERVYRETFILTQLKHVNIIKLFEVLDTPKSILLVMEYAGGGELFSLVASKQRLTELESCRLFQQIVAGVEYCHRAKIIHRDLKLENILLDKNGQVKIADFGLSNSFKFGQKMDTSCGTPSYTCPEAIMGKKYIGHAADIWSLGVILFAMISGFLPFEAASIPLLFKKIKHRQYKCPDYISKEACDLLDRMLTVDPDKRSTLAEIRNHPWMLMEYTELAETIESGPPVTAEMIAEARAQSIAVGDEAANINSTTSNTNATGNQPPKRLNPTKSTGTAATAAASSPKEGSSHTNDATSQPSSSSSSSSSKKDGGTTTEGDGVTQGNGSNSGRSGSVSDRTPHGDPTSINPAAAMGMRSRGERRQSVMSAGVRGVDTNGAGSGRQPAQPLGAKGYRELRNSGGGSSSAGSERSRNLSIFDKLSVRIADASAAITAANNAGAINSGGRYTRFSPATDATPNSAHATTGVRFPPIGSTPPNTSPISFEHKVSANGPSTGGRGIHSHGHGRASIIDPYHPTHTRRKPSELYGHTAGLPSYMQPTEAAQNHLLASEREREASEAEKDALSPNRARPRGASIGAHNITLLSPHLPPSKHHRERTASSLMGNTILTDVLEDGTRAHTLLATSAPRDHHYARPRASSIQTTPGPSSAPANPNSTTNRTPRTRDLLAATIGNPNGLPAYMLDTSSSRQRTVGAALKAAHDL